MAAETIVIILLLALVTLAVAVIRKPAYSRRVGARARVSNQQIVDGKRCRQPSLINAVNKSRVYRPSSNKKPESYGRSARVIKVIDGDTVIASRNFRTFKIRLDSIDSPECGQYWGDIARFGLIKLIGGRRVRLEEHGKDRDGRVLATVYLPDAKGEKMTNVNEKMVVRGNAWVMQAYFGHLSAERQVQLVRLEKWARSQRIGLWQMSNPIPPWKWRRGD